MPPRRPRGLDPRIVLKPLESAFPSPQPAAGAAPHRMRERFDDLCAE